MEPIQWKGSRWQSASSWEQCINGYAKGDSMDSRLLKGCRGKLALQRSRSRLCKPMYRKPDASNDRRRGSYEHICEPTVADAILDLLFHTAHKLHLKGDSMRKTTPP